MRERQDRSHLVYITFAELGPKGKNLEELIREIARQRGKREPERIGFIPIEATAEEFQRDLLEKGLELQELFPTEEPTAGIKKLLSLYKKNDPNRSTLLAVFELSEIGLCILDIDYEQHNEIFNPMRGSGGK